MASRKLFGISDDISVGTENCRIRLAKPCGGRTYAARYSVFKELFLAALAGAILNEFEMGRKVICHRCGLWKTLGGQRPQLALACCVFI
jgi:hypothetical protein